MGALLGWSKNLTQRFMLRSKKLPQLQESLLQRIIVFVQQKDSIDSSNLMKWVDELSRRNSAYDNNNSMDEKVYFRTSRNKGRRHFQGKQETSVYSHWNGSYELLDRFGIYLVGLENSSLWLLGNEFSMYILTYCYGRFDYCAISQSFTMCEEMINLLKKIVSRKLLIQNVCDGDSVLPIGGNVSI